MNKMLSIEGIKKPETFRSVASTSNHTHQEASPLTSISHLNDSFISYRDSKIELKRLYESNKLKRKSYRSNPKRMWELRMKFIEQAKKYLGIPYAQKYFSRDTPEYHSHLFLDCCGLVRKVMRDLQKDFGFRIGGGNQAYQFDTLPGEIKRLEDVKPGDLVFMSGIYNSPRLKLQPHNITHVEIMLGDGEKTIGSRWNNGTVSIFDSYKFISKSFHSEKYYIKSLDPWLWGYCRSYCPKHAWSYNTIIPTLKTSFYTQHEAAFRNKLKQERKTAIDFRKNHPNENTKAKKKRRRIKKIKKLIKKPTKPTTTNVSDKPRSTSQIQLVEEQSKSEFDYHSESEYDLELGQDEAQDEAEDSDCCQVEENTEEVENVEDELNCDGSVDQEDYLESVGGSNCADYNSECSFSSMSDTFFYENFPSKSRTYSRKKNAVEYDDDIDVECSNFSFSNVLRLGE